MRQDNRTHLEHALGSSYDPDTFSMTMLSGFTPAAVKVS